MLKRCCGVLPLVLGCFAAWTVTSADDAPTKEAPGFLGVLLDRVPADLEPPADTERGVFLRSVVPGSPAEKAGLRRSDIIVTAAGEEVNDPEALRNKVRSLKAGDVLALGLRRGAENLQLKVTLGVTPEAQGEVKPWVERLAKPSLEAQQKKGFLGVGFGDVPAILALHLGLAEGTGVVVGDVWKGSPAQAAGIEKHDLLLAWDGYEIKGPQEFSRLASEKKPGDKVKIELMHKGTKRTVDVALSERPKELCCAGEGSCALGECPHGDVLHPFSLGGPGQLRKGRVIIEGPKGQVYRFEVPDGVWQAEEIAKDFQKRMQNFEVEVDKVQKLFDPEELTQKFKKLTEDLDRLRLDDRWDDDVVVRSPVRNSSVVRMVEDGYDITVSDEDGSRTVTVKKGEEVIADNLPYDKLSTLSEDVRGRVEKVVGGLKPVKLAPLPAAKESKIRA